MRTTQEERQEWLRKKGDGYTSAVGEYTPSEFWYLLSDVEQLERALRLILPMAKGYAAQNKVGSNSKKIEFAESLLGS